MMPENARSPVHEAVLDHADFVRALSRQLLAADTADDIEQETWLAMLEGGDDSIRSSRRGWLAGVVRNLSRHEHRRRWRRENRERRVARSEAQRSTIDEVERRETLRVVSRAVFELPESLQSVVVLRYYENLSRREIAARLGIGVDGVKSRLRRALGELRARLDHAHGGDRSAWTAALAIVSGAGPGHGASATVAAAGAGAPITTGFLGVFLMSIKTPLISGAVCTVVLFLAWSLWRDVPAPVSDSDETSVEADTETAPKDEVLLASQASVSVTDDNGTRAKAPEPTDPLAAGVVHGRVVDERRRPIADAIVELWLPGRELRTKRTSADGYFRFAGLERPQEGRTKGAVLAYDGAGHAAVVECFVSALSVFENSTAPRFHARTLAAQDLEEIPLHRARRFGVVALDEGKPAAGVEFVVESGHERVVVRHVVTDDMGLASLPWLPEGIVFVATAGGDRVGHSTGPIDATSSPLVVNLRPARSVDVFVTDARTGEPVEGAGVRIREQRLVAYNETRSKFGHRPFDWRLGIAPTDERGRTKIESLPSTENLAIVVTKRGYGRIAGSRWLDEAGATIEKGAAFVEVSLDRLETRSVRIPVVDGLAPVPASGTLLSIRDRPNFVVNLPQERPTEGRVEEGFIAIEDAPPGYFAALAETPDGNIAPIRVNADGTVRETSFRPARTIEVRVTYFDGSPAVGAPIQIDKMPETVFETDDTGTARIEGLYGAVVRVTAYHPDHAQCFAAAGSVDLAVGDGSLKATLPYVAPMQLQFFDGDEPRLPSFVRLHVEPGSGILEERPDDGVLVVGVYPDPEVEGYRVSGFFADGYLAPAIEVPAEFVESDRPFRVDLIPECSILVTPSRSDDTPMALMLERWDETTQSFGPMPYRTKYEHPTDGRGRVRIGRLAAGRYRVLDEVTGIVSNAVDLALDRRHAKVSIDLAEFRRVTGRVIAPIGTDVSLIRIIVREPGLPRRDSSSRLEGRLIPEGLQVDHDGAFEVSMPTDRALLVEAWHPFLTAAPGRGAVEVDASSSEVVLELERGPEVRFEVPQDAGRISFRAQGIYVELYEGIEASGIPVFSTQARIDEGVARFGGFVPGRYTMWIDPVSGYAPILLRNVELLADEKELELDFERGASVRLRILVPEGEVIPRTGIEAELESEGPRYRRATSARGKSELVLHGLGPGTFQITYGIGQDDPREQTVRLDGSEEHEIVIDLR